MRARVQVLLAALAAASSGPLPAQPKSDWETAEEERSWREGEIALPPYPKAAHLVEFHVSATTGFRFFVDHTSLSVGKDGVVRYTLIARSASGVDNVSYEGIRCQSGTVRAYAFGQGVGRWSARGTAWRGVDPRGAQRWHFVLWRDYFCRNAIAIHDAAEGIDALRRGGHPEAAREDTFRR